MADPNSIDNRSSSSAAGRHGQVQEEIASLVRGFPRGTHLTAPEVHRLAREAGLAVSLSTVYRVLKTLQESGNVTTLVGDRGRRYEAHVDGDDHDHLICVKCGLTIEFVDDLTRGFGKSVAQRKGFEHKSSRFDILGLCADCQAQDEARRIEQAVASLQQAIASARESASLCQSAVSLHETRRTARAQEATAVAREKLQSAVEALDAAIANHKVTTA